jgi:uncharacterized protein YjbI with pentapeptide repeats
MFKRIPAKGMLITVVLFLYAGCGGGGSGPVESGTNYGVQKSGYHEHEFSQNQGLRALPLHTVIVSLEHSSHVPHEDDTLTAGVDAIPYHYPATETYTFCMEDDNGEAHYMTMVDAKGNEVVRVEAGGECITRTIEKGNYTKYLYHGGTGGVDSKPKLVFIQSVKQEPGAGASIIKAAAQTGGGNKIDMTFSHCVGCDFSDMDLQKYDFQSADLSQANFTGARLEKTSFIGAQLQGANFSAAKLAEANFNLANIKGTIFTGAKFNSIDEVVPTVFTPTVDEVVPTEFPPTVLTGTKMGVYKDGPIKLASAPRAYLYGEYHHIVVWGTDGNLWYRWYKDNGKRWGEWQKIADNTLGEPSMNMLRYGENTWNLTVFFKSKEGLLDQVHLTKFSETKADNTWTEPWHVFVGDDFKTVPVSLATGSIFKIKDLKATIVFITGADGTLQKLSFPAPTKSGWMLEDYGYKSATSLALGSVNVYYQGTDGKLKFRNNADPESVEQDTYLAIASAPSVIERDRDISYSDETALDTFYVYYMGMDKKLHYASDGSWKDHLMKNSDGKAIPVSSAPAVIHEYHGSSSDFVFVYYRGGDGNLYQHISRLPSNWTTGIGPSDQGCPPSDIEVRVTSFSGADLRGAKFDADLRGESSGAAHIPTDFVSRVNLSKAKLYSATFQLEDWRYFDLSEAHIVDLKDDAHLDFLEGADLSSAKLTGIDFSGQNLKHANLTGANLNKATLIGIDLESANLSHAQLREASLGYANLKAADLTGAFLEADEGYKAARLSYAYLPNAILADAHLNGVNFSYAQIYGADATVFGATMQDADFANANLSGLNLTDGKLQGANFAGANLVNTDFTSADLKKANLPGAYLQGADFTAAELDGADLTGAVVALAAGSFVFEQIGDGNTSSSWTVYYATTTLPEITTTSTTSCPSGEDGPCAGDKLIAPTPTPKCVASGDHRCPRESSPTS